MTICGVRFTSLSILFWLPLISSLFRTSTKFQRLAFDLTFSTGGSKFILQSTTVPTDQPATKVFIVDHFQNDSRPSFIPKRPRGYNRFMSSDKFTYDPVKRRERERLSKEEMNEESRSGISLAKKRKQKQYQNPEKQHQQEGQSKLNNFISGSKRKSKIQEISKILRLAATGDADGSLRALKDHLAQANTRFTLREFNLLIKNLGDDGFLDQCSQVLKIMRNYGFNPSIITYSTLISRAATWKKIEVAEIFFRQLVADGIKADVQAYNSLINAYTKAKDMDRALLVFNEMVGNGVLPSVITFNSLIECSARNGNVTRAIEIIQLMKSSEYNIDPNERSYSALVLALCQGGKAKVALDLVKRMETGDKNVSFKPSAVTFSALLHGLGTEGDLDAAFEVLSYMKQRGLSPNVVTMSSLIHSCGIHDKLDLAFSLYQEMLNSTKPESLPNSVTCSALVDACLKRGHVERAIEVVHDMRKLKVKLTEVTYTSLITELSRLRKLDRLLGILHQVERDWDGEVRGKSPTPSSSTFLSSTSSMSSSFSNNGVATRLTDATSTHSTVTLNTTSSTLSSSRFSSSLTPSSSANLRLWAGAGLQPPDEREEEDFISTKSTAATKETIPTYKAAVMAYENMKKQGQAPDEMIFKNLMKTMPSTIPYTGNSYDKRNADGASTQHMRHDERLFRLYLVFQEMRASGVQPDTAIYNTLINACATGGDIERALEAVQAMQMEGVELDVITYTSLIKACGINGGPGTIALAEEIFDAMQQRTNHFSSYTEPTELTFQRLMQVHLRGDRGAVAPNSFGTGKDKKVINTKRVWSLMENLIQRGLKPGVSICRSCIRAACHDGDARMALQLLQVLRTTTRVKYDYVSWEQVARLCSKTKEFAAEAMLLRKEIEEKRISGWATH